MNTRIILERLLCGPTISSSEVDGLGLFLPHEEQTDSEDSHPESPENIPAINLILPELEVALSSDEDPEDRMVNFPLYSNYREVTTYSYAQNQLYCNYFTEQQCSNLILCASIFTGVALGCGVAYLATVVCNAYSLWYTATDPFFPSSMPTEYSTFLNPCTWDCADGNWCLLGSTWGGCSFCCIPLCSYPAVRFGTFLKDNICPVSEVNYPELEVEALSYSFR